MSAFEYSHVFRGQLFERFRALAKRIGQSASQELLDGFIIGFEERIKTFPESAPLCEEAADLGLTTYHDYVDPKLQLRVINAAIRGHMLLPLVVLKV